MINKILKTLILILVLISTALISADIILNINDFDSISSRKTDYTENGLWINNRSKYVKSTKGYTDNRAEVNIYEYDSLANGAYIMNNNKYDNGGAKYFNDNGAYGDGNEEKYSPVLTIYFPSNIDYIDISKIEFEVKDYYRYTKAGGSNQGKYDSIKTVSILSPSQFNEDNISDTSYGFYDDHIYSCDFGHDNSAYPDGKEHKYNNYKFRYIYENKPLGESDNITIYQQSTSELENDGNGWGGHGHIDEGYISASNGGNNDIFLNNSLKIYGTAYYDAPQFDKFDFDEITFAEHLFLNVESANKDYEKLDESNQYYTDADINSFDKITYSFNGSTYEALLEEYFKSLYSLRFDGYDDFIKYFDYTYANNKLSRDFTSDDLLMQFGDMTGEEGIVPSLDKYSNDLSKTQTKINNSEINIRIKINPDSGSSDYKDKIIYDNKDTVGPDYGFSTYNDIEESFSINIPFYNWIFEEIPTADDHKTFFDQETKFYIPDIDYKKSMFKSSYDINVYTNTNLKFTIKDDSNISSIVHNGNNISPYANNSFSIETNFNEIDGGSTIQQREKVVISYKNKVTIPDYENPVAQSINLNFIYDADSPLDNKSDMIIEDVGENSKEITSNVMSIVEDSNSFNESDSSTDNLINYYKAKNDVKITFTDEQLSMISNIDYGESMAVEEERLTFNNIYKYSPQEIDGTMTLVKEDYDRMPFTNIIYINEPGLYNWKLKTKTDTVYSYWIMVSKNYVDFGEDDGISSNNSFPVEWIPLKEAGIVNYNEDEEYYSYTHSGKEYYIKKYLETKDGEELLEKGKKKGWTKSELSREPDYSIKMLESTWDKLFDFVDIKINIDEVANATSDRHEKDRNKFKSIKGDIELEIANQLIEDNGLTYTDFKITFEDENGEPLPDNKIIKTKDLIHVTINSSKYGRGVNKYEFEFYPAMIQPMPLVAQTSIVLLVLAALALIVLVIMSVINRQRLIKIKE